MLELRWQEPFANPVSCAPEDLTLGEEYEFAQTPESVFNLGAIEVKEKKDEVKEKKDGEKKVREDTPPALAQAFRDALGEWDRLLRYQCRFRFKSKDKQELEKLEISLRQDILGWYDFDRSAGELSEPLREVNIRRFQDWLKQYPNLRSDPDETGKHRIRIEFAFGPQTYMQSQVVSRSDRPFYVWEDLHDWNYRVKDINVRLESTGKNMTGIFGSSLKAHAYIAQSGFIFNYQATPCKKDAYCPPTVSKNLDDYVRYHPKSLVMSDRNQYFLYETNIYVDDSVAPSSASRPGNRQDSDSPDGLLGKMWSPFCNRWILEIETAKVDHIAFSAIKDIWLTIDWTGGPPRCLPGLGAVCMQ